MKKVKIEKSKIINFANAMNNYISKNAMYADKLYMLCQKLLEYTPNEKFIEDHNTVINKKTKQLERDCRDSAYDFALLNDDKTIVKEASGSPKFTVENQKLYNVKVDKLNDEYSEFIDLLMKEKADFYIETITEDKLPARLTQKERVDLSLVIIKNND